MTGSPIEQLLAAINELDADAVIALLAPQTRLLAADGSRAEGKQAVREHLTSFFGALRAISVRLTASWHQDDTWIAEVETTYELRDWLQTEPFPRAFIVHAGPQGITDVHVYGAHERSITERRDGEEGPWVGWRWVPPL